MEFGNTWEFTRMIIQKYNDYEFLTEQEWTHLEQLIANDQIPRYLDQRDFLFKLMKDDLLWALSLVIAKQKRAYCSNICPERYAYAYSHSKHLPETLSEECS